MGDILTIRLPAGEKAQWEEAAKATGQTVAEYVRTAVRQRRAASEASCWDRHVGSVDVTVSPPTNRNVRRAFARRSRRGR